MMNFIFMTDGTAEMKKIVDELKAKANVLDAEVKVVVRYEEVPEELIKKEVKE